MSDDAQELRRLVAEANFSQVLLEMAEESVVKTERKIEKLKADLDDAKAALVDAKGALKVAKDQAKEAAAAAKDGPQVVDGEIVSANAGTAEIKAG